MNKSKQKCRHNKEIYMNKNTHFFPFQEPIYDKGGVVSSNLSKNHEVIVKLGDDLHALYGIKWVKRNYNYQFISIKKIKSHSNK